jgi:hypothetical protein
MRSFLKEITYSQNGLLIMVIPKSAEIKSNDFLRIYLEYT